MQLIAPLSIGELRPEPVALGDDDLASHSPARLLITAASSGAAETQARRIHDFGVHRDGPFVRAAASDLPVDGQSLRQMCVQWLDEAAGGTLFVNAVETMPTTVQGVFVELLNELGQARDAAKAVRLISGTAVSLLDRVAAGTFDETLFYRLNIIHLTRPAGSQAPPA
jgi:DNA-binding NtrC family response regulator